MVSYKVQKVAFQKGGLQNTENEIIFKKECLFLHIEHILNIRFLIKLYHLYYVGKDKPFILIAFYN